MPRPPRDDHRPIIEVPGLSREQEVRQALAGRLELGRRERVYIYQATNNPSQFYFKIFDEQLRERLELARASGSPIDEGLFLRLCMLVDRAKIQPTGEPPHERNGLFYEQVRLVSVGCRIRYAHMGDLASRVGIAEKTLVKKLGPMRRSYLIVNQYEGRGCRQGWIELAADVVWRGDERIRKAYAATQRVNDGVQIVGLD